MIEYPELEKKGKEFGFTHVSSLDCKTLNLMQEVRDMCAANTCGQYNKRWSCPPGCGVLETCRINIQHYKEGLLVQTVGELEDSMDYEAMMETEAMHKEHFLGCMTYLKTQYPNLLALGAGCCTICSVCSYPDSPCRFPDKAISSMEAYGILVNQVCTDNQLSYYYGPDKIAFTSCYLLV